MAAPDAAAILRVPDITPLERELATALEAAQRTIDQMSADQATVWEALHRVSQHNALLVAQALQQREQVTRWQEWLKLQPEVL